MSRERDLLVSCLDEFQYHEVPCSDLIRTIQWLLNEPEQTEQKPLTREEISYGFRTNDDAINAESYWAGVKWAEQQHGIGV